MTRVRNDWRFEVLRYGRRRRSFVPPDALAVDGDSLAVGSAAAQCWGAQLGEALALPFSNFATSGHTSAQWLAGVPAALASLAGTNPAYLVQIGTNTLNSSGTAAAVFADIVAGRALFRAAFPHGKFGVCKVLKSTALTGGEETQRVALNALVDGLSSADDAVLDFPAESALNDPTNTAWFTDGTHPDLPGEEVEAYRAYETIRDKGWLALPADLTQGSDLAGCLMEVHAGVGLTLAGSDVSTWGDQTSNAHSLFFADSLAAGRPEAVADAGDGGACVRFAAGESLCHSYAAHPSVTHVNTGAAYTRVMLKRMDVAASGFTSSFAGAVNEGKSHTRVVSGTLAQSVQDDASHVGDPAASGGAYPDDRWLISIDDYDGATHFGCQVNTRTRGTATVASFGASTSKRFLMNGWQTDGGFANSIAMDARSALLFTGVKSAQDRFRLRYWLRRAGRRWGVASM